MCNRVFSRKRCFLWTRKSLFSTSHLLWSIYTDYFENAEPWRNKLRIKFVKIHSKFPQNSRNNANFYTKKAHIIKFQPSGSIYGDYFQNADAWCHKLPIFLGKYSQISANIPKYCTLYQNPKYTPSNGFWAGFFTLYMQ